jgi:hypothetical protein
VSELHKLGYERTRIAPQIGDSPGGGVWECEIVPVTMISRQHGAVIAESAGDDCGTDFPFWTSRQWRSPRPHPIISDSPAESATRLLQEYPELALQGVGSDTEYAEWYDDMLKMTEPEGVIFAKAWYDAFKAPAVDGMRVLNAPEGLIVPLPPPGEG